MTEVLSPIVYKRVEVLCYKNSKEIFYDKYSNKLIVINRESNKVIVISKDGKKIVKEMHCRFSLNMMIYKVTFNCELNFMMMLTQ